MADLLPFRAVVTNPPDDATPAPLVVDAKRLAVMLNASLRTVRTWDVNGKLPAPIRIGGRVVWRLDEIRAWLDAGAPDRTEWTARRAARK